MASRKRKPPPPVDDEAVDIDPSKKPPGSAPEATEAVDSKDSDEPGSDEIELSADQKREVIEEARDRFQYSESESSDNRRRFKEAIDFIAGEQWDPQLKRQRQSGPSPRPCLTMDRITTHVNQAVNAMRQNKPAIKTHPIDDSGDIEVAEVYDGVIRHIEAVSNADTAYETAMWCACAGGIGYWRVLTKYNDETSFEQDIVIQRITNPLAVYFDPASREQDGSDSHFAFVIDSIDRKDFERRYPGVDTSDWEAGTDAKGWYDEKRVRLADYFRVRHDKQTLFLLDDGTSVFEDDYESDDGKIVKRRKGWRRIVEWFLIGGKSIVDSRTWPGRWIPIVRVVGNEIDIEGDVQYTGLVHRAMDAQRAYNYWVSTVTETAAQTKTAPFIGAKGQFKGVEDQWKNAGTRAYLEYEPITINEHPAPPPQRQTPPAVPTGAVEIVRMMADDMHWITGQQEANFGAPSNEQSGRAIIARAQQGDNATYHYLDNCSRSIRHTGRIIVDLTPRVMDTRRILRALGEDGSSQYVEHDPDAPKPMQDVPEGPVDPNMPSAQTFKRIFNLGVGRYDVEVSVGPNFTTRRLEAVDAMQALLQSDPNLWTKIGDIYLRNQDWPGAQDMADRLAKMVDPKLKDDPNAPGGGDPTAQMQQALAGANQQLQELTSFREHAIQAADAADKEIADLKQQLQEQQFDMDAKNFDTRAKLDASKYSDDVKLEIARIGAVKDESVAAIAAFGDQIGEIQQVIAAIAKFTGAVAPDAGSAPPMQ